jgi:hypothetical protein
MDPVATSSHPTSLRYVLIFKKQLPPHRKHNSFPLQLSLALKGDNLCSFENNMKHINAVCGHSV